ncbi:MAG: XrtA-associated tyrosine autokinase [Pseudomonadota bacterium]
MKKRRAQRKGGASPIAESAGEEAPADLTKVQQEDQEISAPEHGLVAFEDEADQVASSDVVQEDELRIEEEVDDGDHPLSGQAASGDAQESVDDLAQAIAAGDTRASQAGAADGAGSPRRSDLPFLELPISALRESGLMPAEGESRRIEDQYRRIKRPLLANAFGINVPRLPKGNLIMVASSLPGEGKSFTSFNLAMSMAYELDRTVLLVDADVAKPHISRALQVQDQPGLIDLISDPKLDLQDVILPTSVDSMRFLPAGPIHRHSTELLASVRAAQLVEELGQRYPDRVIIFDTPPLIPTTEAQAMAHLMGQIVVVVHAGHTPQSAVLQSLEGLEGTGEISLVLNKTRTAWGDEYSGYGYDGPYGYGSQ